MMVCVGIRVRTSTNKPHPHFHEMAAWAQDPIKTHRHYQSLPYNSSCSPVVQAPPTVGVENVKEVTPATIHKRTNNDEHHCSRIRRVVNLVKEDVNEGLTNKRTPVIFGTSSGVLIVLAHS